MATETRARLKATARRLSWPSNRKNRMNGVLAQSVTASAAGRRCIRQKTQPMTVSAMQNMTWLLA